MDLAACAAGAARSDAFTIVPALLDDVGGPASPGFDGESENVERMLTRQRCAVLNHHKMRTPIQCDTHEWRPRARDQGQVDSVKPR